MNNNLISEESLQSLRNDDESRALIKEYLVSALEQGKKELAILFVSILDGDDDVNVQNVQLEQSDILKTLLEAGADVRACDDLALRYTPEKGEISRILDEAKKRLDEVKKRQSSN